MSRWVFTDIHGCYHSLKALLEEKVVPAKKDVLYFLGDYISKGPYSKQVLDYLMSLQERGYQLKLLRGNHEQELLNVLAGTTSLTTFRQKGGFTFLRNFGVDHPAELPPSYISFIEQLGWYISLNDFLLVHAGFDFSADEPYRQSEVLLNIRDYAVDLSKTAGRRVIHGHSPTDLHTILKTLEQRDALHLSLDAGCAYRNNPAQAHLLALNLDSWSWQLQKNIDESDNYHP